MFLKLNFWNNENGAVLLLVALFLPIILGLLALIINAGNIYYAKSIYNVAGNTATASALSLVGDKMAIIVQQKINSNPSLTINYQSIWENLNDQERLVLTSDPEIIQEVQEKTKNYLNENIQANNLMRNDFKVKNIVVTYPYNYQLTDKAVKVHLEFQVETPINFIKTISNKNITIEAESQLRIK